MVNVNVFQQTNSKLNPSALNCPNRFNNSNTAFFLKSLPHNEYLTNKLSDARIGSAFMYKCNASPAFYIKNANFIQTTQMPLEKFSFVQSAFLNENPHLQENNKENNIFPNKIFSDLFQSKYGNLAPARVIHQNLDFSNSHFKSNGNLQKNEVFYDDNDSNSSNEDFDWDYKEESIININCNASFIEKFSADVKPVNTHQRSLTSEMSTERIVTGQGLTYIKEEISSEDLVNLKSHINLDAKILPPYKLIPLDTIRKTPSLALQFDSSDLHKNFFEDPRVNKRFINYEQS